MNTATQTPEIGAAYQIGARRWRVTSATEERINLAGHGGMTTHLQPQQWEQLQGRDCITLVEPAAAYSRELDYLLTDTVNSILKGFHLLDRWVVRRETFLAERGLPTQVSDRKLMPHLGLAFAQAGRAADFDRVCEKFGLTYRAV